MEQQLIQHAERVLQTTRDIEHLYPHLHVWGWPIAVDLFFGGLAAGILFFTAYYFLSGKEEKMPFTVKIAPYFTFSMIAICLLMLLYDLHHKLYFWNLYLTFRIESPMSWGAWTLTAVTLLSLLWPLGYLDEVIDYARKRGWKYVYRSALFVQNAVHRIPLLGKIQHYVIKYRKTWAVLMLGLAIGLGIYTGILLSAFNARPLWNTAVLGPLFLTSGVTTGAAFLAWLTDNESERKTLINILLFLIALKLFFIIHMIMSMLSGAEAYKTAAEMLLGGSFTVYFWVFVVGMGLVIPFVLLVLKKKGYSIPMVVPALMILLGGFAFRMIIVYAGQMSAYPF